MSLDSRYEVNKPDVVDESVDGEVLIVHLGTGAYYSSRGVGDAAWQLIAAGSTALETSGLLQAARPAVADFVEHLLAEGLIRPRTKPVEPPPRPHPRCRRGRLAEGEARRRGGVMP